MIKIGHFNLPGNCRSAEYGNISDYEELVILELKRLNQLSLTSVARANCLLMLRLSLSHFPGPSHQQ